MDPSLTRLPYDIFILIIRELASQCCYEDLRACSQTCRMLLHPCRVHLFSSISIGNNARQFATLLNGNSAIPNYVQNLTYQPTILSEDIANALLLLNNIRSFVLCGSHYAWDSLTPHIQHALINLFSSSSVTRISICQLSHFPAILLSSSSNLKHLVIRRETSFISEMCDTTLYVHGPPKLLSLDISRATIPTVDEWHPVGKSRADGLPLLDLSALQSLAFRMEGMRKTFLENILGTCLKLERLSVSGIIYYHSECVPSSMNVPPAIQDSIPDDMLKTIRTVLPTIRSLKLEWWLHADLISFEFPEVIKVLQMLAHQPNRIIKLQLLMWIPGSHTWADQDWGRIDRILVDRSNFQELEKLDLKLWVHHWQGVSDYEKRTHMAQFKTTKLPLLCLAADDDLDFNISYF